MVQASAYAWPGKPPSATAVLKSSAKTWVQPGRSPRGMAPAGRAAGAVGVPTISGSAVATGVSLGAGGATALWVTAGDVPTGTPKPDFVAVRGITNASDTNPISAKQMPAPA